MPGTTRDAGRRRTVRRLLGVTAWALLAGLTAPTPAGATLYIWQGPNTGGEWTNPANWAPSTGYPNGDFDVAVIGGKASAIIIAIPGTVAPTITLQQLLLGGSSNPGGPISIVGISSLLILKPPALLPGISVTGGGNDTIQVPVRLTTTACIIEAADATLTFLLPISQDSFARGLTKVGNGTMVVTGGTTYAGNTTIAEGILSLPQPNMIVDTATVDVRPGAVLLADRNETIGLLRITEGVVRLGANTTLSVAALDMTAGQIEVSGAPATATMALRGNANATSTDQQIAIIAPTVRLDLGNTTRTFTVNNGPNQTDAQMFGVFIGPPADTSVGVTLEGTGTMHIGPGPASTYAGLTWVKSGRLILESQLTGDVRVGDGVGGSRQASLLAAGHDRIGDTRTVTVESDGLYDMSNVRETIDRLTVNGGEVNVGELSSGSLRVHSLVMNGGLIRTGIPNFPGSEVRLLDGPNLRFDAAAIDALVIDQIPTIEGPGRLVLEGTPQIVVHDNGHSRGLIVEAVIVSPTGRGVRMSGPGTAHFKANNTYTGATIVEGGTLWIDGSQPASPIALGGGTLGGRGLTGPIAATAGGTIAPGLSPGVLHSGNVALAAGARFLAELNGATAGTGHDQLQVTGTIALGGATLTLTLDDQTTLPINAKLTIIDNDGTDAVTGTFANLAEGATIIAARHAFLLTYQGGDDNDVVLTVTNATAPIDDPTPGAVTYYLAEGATGGFFDEDVLIANPNDADAPVTLTFLQEGGGTIVDHRTVPKQARLTVHVDQIAGLENASPSVQILSDQKLPLIAERSMFWDASYYGGHTANAVGKPETTWIFAEGFQGFFDTYLLIANANATETTATVTFLRENDTPVVKVIPIAAFARKTIYAGDFSELIGRAFGMVVDATQPVIAERSMYFASIPNRLWTGGHVNTGVTAPSTSWFHAEGATGGFFSTFILLSNPQTTDAHIDLRFLLEDGTTIVRTKTLPAGQRLTVNPAAEGDPRLENAALSTIVASDVPIVSERSMYWPGDATPFGEGHNSSGVVATATRWGLAEGRIGTPRHFTTYILLANPTTNAAQVTVTYLREAGAAVTKTYTVPPTSRFNIDVASAVPELHDENFGARIEVTNSVAIAVERSLYWDANGIFWAGGSNALGTPLP
jgi:autotransporter-associated beta strand protein